MVRFTAQSRGKRGLFSRALQSDRDMQTSRSGVNRAARSRFLRSDSRQRARARRRYRRPRGAARRMLARRRRVQGLVDKYGLEKFIEYKRQLGEYSERLIRSAIAAIPDSRLRVCPRTCSNTTTASAAVGVKHKLTIKIRGDSLTADFTGSEGSEHHQPRPCLPASKTRSRNFIAPIAHDAANWLWADLAIERRTRDSE
jgi:hypothetical protein